MLIAAAKALADTRTLQLDPGSRVCIDHDPLDQCPLCKQFHPAIPNAGDSRMAARKARECASRLAPGPTSNAEYLGGASDYCETEYR